MLAALVIGSGIAAQQLSPGDTGLELLENAAATAAGLFTIILMFGPVSGGHFNPVVSFIDAAFGGLSWRDAGAYLPVQLLAAWLAPWWRTSCSPVLRCPSRSITGATAPHLFSEVVATAGLILVIFALVRTGRGRIAPAAVGAYIGAAYFFTSSASFANPAITVGRMFSNTFAGIACGSRKPCHLMRPGRIHGSSRRAGPAAAPGYLCLLRPERVSCGWILLRGPVRPMRVAVIGVLAKNQQQVPLASNQHLVQALAAGTADPAFGDSVRPRRLDRCLDDPHADRGEHRVEGGGELGIQVQPGTPGRQRDPRGS